MYGFVIRFAVRTAAHFTSIWTAPLNRAALRVITPLQYLMGVACVLIVTLALLEPASSAGLNLLSRALFWSLHLVPATMIAWVISGWLFNMRASRRVSPWLLLVVAGGVTGLLLAPISVTLEALLGVVDTTNTQSSPLLSSREVWLNELKAELHAVPLKTASLWPLMNAFVIWRIGGMHHGGVGSPPDANQLPGFRYVSPAETSSPASNGATEAMSEQDEGYAASKQTRSEGETSGFLPRLPASLGRDIVFVEAQEHYLRIVTIRGEHLLLQGLTHAIAELEANGFDGIQIHRSVWVAWKHVENVDVRPGAVSVAVSTGARWKISRRRAKAFLATWRLRRT